LKPKDFIKLVNELPLKTVLLIDGVPITVKEIREGIKHAEEKQQK